MTMEMVDIFRARLFRQSDQFCQNRRGDDDLFTCFLESGEQVVDPLRRALPPASRYQGPVAPAHSGRRATASCWCRIRRSRFVVSIISSNFPKLRPWIGLAPIAPFYAAELQDGVAERAFVQRLEARDRETLKLPLSVFVSDSSPRRHKRNSPSKSLFRELLRHGAGGKAVALDAGACLDMHWALPGSCRQPE